MFVLRTTDVIAVVAQDGLRPSYRHVFMGNHNSGRRPQPTALKLLRGNPGKRRLNEREPQPPDGPVERPMYLSGQAVLVWDELAPVALHMGTLTRADTSAFARLCELESSARWASSQKTEMPSFIKLELETAAAVRPYYEKFGLEPVGRSRIVITQPQVPRSKWEGLVG